MVSSANLFQRMPSALWARREAVGHKSCFSWQPAMSDVTSGQASHHPLHRMASRSSSVMFFQRRFSYVIHHHLVCFWNTLSRPGLQRFQADRPSERLLLEFLRQQRSRVGAVRAKRLTTEHHAPTQKVKKSLHLLLRCKRFTKANGAAAARHKVFGANRMGRNSYGVLAYGVESLGIPATRCNEFMLSPRCSSHHVVILHTAGQAPACVYSRCAKYASM
jgi:hypothetical protein